MLKEQIVKTDNTITNQEDHSTSTSNDEQPTNEVVETNTETASKETASKETLTESTSKEEDKQKELKEKIKQLSSEYKLNLFEREGVISLAEELKNTRSTLEELNTKINSIEEENSTLKAQEKDYEDNIWALQEGFTFDNLPEAKALASVNIKEGETVREALVRVKEKYSSIFAPQTTSAGIIHNDTQRLQEEKKATEAERYMSNNPKYKNYYSKK